MNRAWLAFGALFVSSSALAADSLSDRLAADAAAACAQDAVVCAQITEAAPVSTRAGFYRFAGPGFDSELVPVLLADRLVNGDDSPEVRRAAGLTLARYPDAAPTVIEIIAQESDPEVRLVMVGGLKNVPGDLVLTALEGALQDSSPAVRAEAARALGQHPAGDQVSGALVGSLADGDAEVRAAAARALGWQKATPAWNALVNSLDDAEPEVRLNALRALRSIDRGATVQLTQLDRLQADADPKVARMATALHAER